MIEAFVCIEGKEFRVEIKNKSSNLCLRAYDKDGDNLTKEYLYLTSHCLEQDLSDVFYGDNDKTLFKLLQYLDEDRYYESKELSRRTDLLSETKSFSCISKGIYQRFSAGANT